MSPEQARTAGVKEHLQAGDVQIREYTAIVDELKSTIEKSSADSKVWLPAPTTSQALACFVEKVVDELVDDV